MASLISPLGPWCQVPMPNMGISTPLLRVTFFWGAIFRMRLHWFITIENCGTTVVSLWVLRLHWGAAVATPGRFIYPRRGTERAGVVRGLMGREMLAEIPVWNNMFKKYSVIGGHYMRVI